jgi:hypothetical protein
MPQLILEKQELQYFSGGFNFTIEGIHRFAFHIGYGCALRVAERFRVKLADGGDIASARTECILEDSHDMACLPKGRG